MTISGVKNNERRDAWWAVGMVNDLRAARKTVRQNLRTNSISKKSSYLRIASGAGGGFYSPVLTLRSAQRRGTLSRRRTITIMYNVRILLRVLTRSLLSATCAVGHSHARTRSASIDTPCCALRRAHSSAANSRSLRFVRWLPTSSRQR